MEKKAIQQFNVELLKLLPLEDDIFFGMVKQAGLFPLNTGNEIKDGKSTRAAKVAHFLQHVIEPGAKQYLPKLLRVMRDTKADDLVELADKIGKEAGLAIEQPSLDQASPPNYNAASGKVKKKVPKENLKYTINDLTAGVKDLLLKFDENVSSMQEDKNDVLLLLMVVNSSEFLAAVSYFSKSDAKILHSEDGDIYYIGKWGQIPAALVRQHDQGTGGIGGSQQLTCSAVKLFKNLKAIIALGVCGTVGDLGDVIVASRIDGCDKSKRAGKRIISRAFVSDPGKTINGFLRHGSDVWSFLCTKEGTEVYNAKVVFKPMLSGTPLIASGAYRNELIDNVSQEAGGVEMEGVGVLEGIKITNSRDKIQFAMVKAGCDYADETKNKEWQPVAAMAAAKFVYEQLNKPVARTWFEGKS